MATEEGESVNDHSDLVQENSAKHKLSILTRKLPIVLDVSIFVMQLCIFVGYLYMTFFYGKLNTIDCHADSTINVPLDSVSSMQGIDVSGRFKMAIRWGFWMSFINFARATLAQVAFYMKLWLLLLISYTMFAMNIAILIILFIMMQLWRWEHSGRVCSGDYLDRDITEEDREKYLIVEGKFIKWVLLIIYIIIGLGFLTMCIVAGCAPG